MKTKTFYNLVITFTKVARIIAVLAVGANIALCIDNGIDPLFIITAIVSGAVVLLSNRITKALEVAKSDFFED